MNNNVLTTKTATKELTELLKLWGYETYIPRVDICLQHIDILIMEAKSMYPIAFMKIAYKKYEDFHEYLIYAGNILALPSQFQRVANIIEKGGN